MVVGIKVNRANNNIVESRNNNITPKCVDKLYSYEEAITLAGNIKLYCTIKFYSLSLL